MTDLTEIIITVIFAFSMAIMYVLGVCALCAELVSRLRRKDGSFASDQHLVEIFLLVPLVSLIYFATGRDWYSHQALISPALRLTIMVLTSISIVAFLYLAHRRRLAPRGIVLAAKYCLLPGPVSCVVFAFWAPGLWLFILLSLPVATHGFMVLPKRRNQL